jgi:hypothetical protein
MAHAHATIRYLLLQVFVLFTQDLLGPRWFLPRRVRVRYCLLPPSPSDRHAHVLSVHLLQFLPDKYDYQRPVHVDAEQGESKECVICMSVVLPNQRDYMVTPCNHLFHQNCLEQWMVRVIIIIAHPHTTRTHDTQDPKLIGVWVGIAQEFKMECPTCRRPLPYP